MTFGDSPDSPSATIGHRLGVVKTIARKLDCSSRHVYRLADAGWMPAPL